MSLEGRVAVVTGAAQGIGRAYAQALAHAAAQVVCADIDSEGAQKTASLIGDDGGTAVALPVDVSDQASTMALAAEVEGRFGVTHIVVNNAAIYHSMRIDSQLSVDIEYWRRMFAVNLEGALLMTQAFAPMLIDAGWGRLIMQSSTAAYSSSAGAYSVSKLALIGLMRGFARELGPHGVTVNAVAPGPIFTDATMATIPQDRLDEAVSHAYISKRADAGDLMGTLLFLCSEASDWMTGQTLFVDGGMTPRV